VHAGILAPGGPQEPRALEAKTPFVRLASISLHGDVVAAIVTMAVAVAVAFLIDRLVIGRGGRYAARIGDRGVSRGAQTRLRVIRRLVFVAILLIGAALALSRFSNFSHLATGILASSAVITLIIGLAARQVLANPMAGLLLAIAQPIRSGDSVTIEGETGRVDDLTLSYTFLDTGDGRLMVVPNEMVVTSVVFNRSTGDRTAPPAASVWVPLDADLGRARAALEAAEIATIEVAETTADGVRLEVHGRRDPERTKTGAEEAKLRERAHEVLRAAGVLA
jgi:small-conductance mechanosensitive channel